MQLKLSLMTVAFACLLFSVTMAHAQMTSQHYAITSSVLSGGGIPMSSSSFQTEGTLGQPSPLMDPFNPPNSTNYDLYPGFWYTLDAVLYGCLWDIEPEFGDGDVDGSDLAEYAVDSIVDLQGFANEFGRADCLD